MAGSNRSSSRKLDGKAFLQRTGARRRSARSPAGSPARPRPRRSRRAKPRPRHPRASRRCSRSRRPDRSGSWPISRRIGSVTASVELRARDGRRARFRRRHSFRNRYRRRPTAAPGPDIRPRRDIGVAAGELLDRGRRGNRVGRPLVGKDIVEIGAETLLDRAARRIDIALQPVALDRRALRRTVAPVLPIGDARRGIAPSARSSSGLRSSSAST